MSPGHTPTHSTANFKAKCNFKGRSGCSGSYLAETGVPPRMETPQQSLSEALIALLMLWGTWIHPTMQLFSSELVGVCVLVLGPSEALHSFLFLMKKTVALSAGVTSKNNVNCWYFHLYLCSSWFQKIFPASLSEHLSYFDILFTQEKLKKNPPNSNKTSNTGAVIKKIKTYKLQNEPEAKS